MAGLGLVHSLYRAHRAVVPATAWHLVKLETGHTNALYQTVYSLPPSLSYFSRDATGQRPTVLLNVQCPRECPRDDFCTLIQLIQQVLRLETRHTNAVYQTVYSLPASLSSFSTDSLDGDDGRSECPMSTRMSTR